MFKKSQGIEIKNRLLKSEEKEMRKPIVSLCLPTNGMIEWVFPALDSIYEQEVENSLFEVIVTNNGDNKEFDIMMTEYATRHSNLIYKKTNAYMFYNQLEALKLASGEYLKFINHRSIFVTDGLMKIINVIRKYEKDKPVIYFSDGVLQKEEYVLNNFDEFVCALGRFASWTTGVGIWKEDYDKIREDVKIDKISPHSCILFSERKKDQYLIENFEFAQDIETDHRKKGKYDLFKAFAVEEITITLNLFIDGDITAETFKTVKQDYRRFVAELYWDFVIRKAPCSYDLSGFNDAMGIFFDKSEIKRELIYIGIKKILYKVKRLGRKK